MNLWNWTGSGGCAAKLPISSLRDALGSLPTPGADFASFDDAAVVSLGSQQVVLTIDFMPPVVPNANDWAHISTLNALSDVYAMGGNPAFALSVLAVPAELSNSSLTEEVISATRAALAEEGALLVGGHTILNDTPLCGLAVVGTLESAPWTKKLPPTPTEIVLTKRVGVGACLSAAKLNRSEVPREILAQLRTSNRGASQVLQDSGAVFACTDVTGFGLGNQLAEVLQLSSQSASISLGDIPRVVGFGETVLNGIQTSATQANADELTRTGLLSWDQDEELLHVLADPQTNGGLLAFVDPDRSQDVLDALTTQGIQATKIGSTEPAETPTLRLRS